MTQDRNIYTAPDGSSPEPRDQPSVDPSPHRERARMKRNTIRSVILMLVLLGIAALLVSRFEKREEERRKRLTGADTLPKRPAGQTPQPLLAAPELSEFSDALDLPAGTRLAEVDRQKVAEAMGEVRIARQYLDVREWDEAETHARRALQIWPEMNAARRLMGFVYLQRGQFDQAVAVLERVLDQEPFSAETYNNLASACMQKWELEKAEELLITSLAVRPNFPMAHINLGLLYLIVGRYEDTIEHLNLALETLPENMAARNNLAVALLRIGRYDEARWQLQHILGRDPARTTAYFNMAITYVLERNFEDAMKYIQLGRQYCSPVACRNFLADSDFDPLRSHPDFQAFINGLYPDLPTLPQG